MTEYVCSVAASGFACSSNAGFCTNGRNGRLWTSSPNGRNGRYGNASNASLWNATYGKLLVCIVHGTCSNLRFTSSCWAAVWNFGVLIILVDASTPYVPYSNWTMNGQSENNVEFFAFFDVIYGWCTFLYLHSLDMTWTYSFSAAASCKPAEVRFELQTCFWTLIL